MFNDMECFSTKNDLAWSLMFAKRLPLQDQHRRAQMVLSRKPSWTHPHHRLSPQKPRAKALPRKGFERLDSFRMGIFWGKGHFGLWICGSVILHFGLLKWKFPTKIWIKICKAMVFTCEVPLFRGSSLTHRGSYRKV